MKVGQTVWFISGNLVCKGKIERLPHKTSYSNVIQVKCGEKVHPIYFDHVFSAWSKAIDSFRILKSLELQRLKVAQSDINTAVRQVEQALSNTHSMGR